MTEISEVGTDGGDRVHGEVPDRPSGSHLTLSMGLDVNVILAPVPAHACARPINLFSKPENIQNARLRSTFCEDIRLLIATPLFLVHWHRSTTGQGGDCSLSRIRKDEYEWGGSVKYWKYLDQMRARGG